MSEEGDLLSRFEGLEDQINAKLAALPREISDAEHQGNCHKVWGLVLNLDQFKSWDEDHAPRADLLQLAFLSDELFKLVEQINAEHKEDKRRGRGADAGDAFLGQQPRQLIRRLVVWGDVIYELLLELEEVDDGGRILVLACSCYARRGVNVRRWWNEPGPALRLGM